jgi:hypothetical protein
VPVFLAAHASMVALAASRRIVDRLGKEGGRLEKPTSLNVLLAANHDVARANNAGPHVDDAR